MSHLNNIKITAVLTCTFLIAILVASYGYADDRTIKVGIPQNPPLGYKDADGKFKGLSVDVLEYVAEKEGWQLQYVHGAWAKNLQWLQSGETDLQAFIAYSEKRAKTYDYTKETLFNNWGQIFIRQGSKIASLLDLNGKTVALVKKNIHTTAFKKLIYGSS